MFEKLVKWIKKKDKEEFVVWALKKLIKLTLKGWHLAKNPVRKAKEVVNEN